MKERIKLSIGIVIYLIFIIIFLVFIFLTSYKGIYTSNVILSAKSQGFEMNLDTESQSSIPDQVLISSIAFLIICIGVSILVISIKTIKSYNNHVK
jgi:hypothetical protein